MSAERPPCHFCGTEVNPARKGSWRQVTGWVQTRSGGGAHGVTLADHTGLYACSECMALARRGIDPFTGDQQGTLL